MSGEGAQRLALALALLVSLLAPLVIAAPLSETTDMDTYDGEAGCYYNFQHYGEGDRIMTNEPCLNCTCHNRMLMCYLRVCPFTKPIGQDCTVEKRGDQCCPVITCPDVPVDLLTSTTESSSVDSTEVGHHDNYGCSIDDKFYSDGAQVPSNPNKPCELCYCIRNMTACVMQECTLHVEGCTPVYNRGVCCPVRYSCDHPEEEGPLMLDDMTTTVKPTPGFMLTTTFAPGYTMECTYRDQMFADGALIATDKACEHCYCMKGDIVCAVQECGTPMENEGKNCTALAPKEGQCCPETYVCDGEQPTTSMGDANMLTTTQRPGTEGMEIEDQKPEVESHTEQKPESVNENEIESHTEQKPESEHKPEIDGVTHKPESSTNVPQTESLITTESEKSSTENETATEHDKLHSESATEHSKPESESATEHGKPESEIATEHKLDSEGVTEHGQPESESSTKHKSDSESVTEHDKSDTEISTEHKQDSESVTKHSKPESESSTEYKSDLESVTEHDKSDTEISTEHKLDSESVTEHGKPESESATEDKLDSESVIEHEKPETESATKYKLDSESVTEHDKPELESVTGHGKPESESSTEHKLDSESVTEHGKPESDSATEDKLDSERVTEHDKPELESVTGHGKPESESSTEHKLDSESVTEHGKPESDSATEDKLDSESVTEHDKSELESVTGHGKPESESSTEHKLDTESVTEHEKPETESATKYKLDSESVTEHDKPELESVTGHGKPESESSTEHKLDSESVTEHGKPESDSATEDKLDSESVTEHGKPDSESTTKHKPELNISSESSTPTIEIDTITENIKSDSETGIDKQKPETETATDHQTPESMSGTESDKPSSQESTEKVKSDSESITEKLIPYLGAVTEDTLGFESSTKLQEDEVVSHTQKPALDIDNDTQTPKYESVTKITLPETEISTIKHDLEDGHKPSIISEHDDHTTAPHSDSESVTETKITESDNEIEGQKLDVGDRFEEQHPETDTSTEEQKLESDNATENIIPETATTVEKKKPESDSQLEQKPDVDHKYGTGKPKLDDESVPVVDLNKMDEQKPEVDHTIINKKPESEQGTTVKADSEEEDDGQKLEGDNESGEQKPEMEHDSSEQSPGLEHETGTSTSVLEQEAESHKPELEDNITTLTPESIQETDNEKPVSESTTGTHKLDLDVTHTPQTPATVTKDDAHKPDESSEDQKSEDITQKSQQDEGTTSAGDVQSLLTTISSVKLDSEEKTTVKSIDVEHGTESYVTKISDLDQSDDQTTVQSVELVTPVRDYKDDDKVGEDVPKQDVGATKVPQHRDEHQPEYQPTESEKDHSYDGTTEHGSNLVTEKTISDTENVETDDETASTENVLHEGHSEDTTKLPSVTDSIIDQVTTIKYQLTEAEQTTVYNEKASGLSSEKPFAQEEEHITDMPDTIVKESSSKLPLDSVTEIYQTTAHKDLDETKPDATEKTEDGKTTDKPISQEDEKLTHEVTPEIEQELNHELTTIDAESDIVQKSTESSVDVGHEGSGSESPETSDEKIVDSSTKTPVLTTGAPKVTTVDYTKYPIIDSESDLPVSHTKIYSDGTSSPVDSLQTTESSVTDQSSDTLSHQTEGHHIDNEVTEKSDIDDIFTFTTVKTISDSTESINDRYQTDSISDTQGITDKIIESVTKFFLGEKDTEAVTGDMTTTKTDLLHSTKVDITTAVPIIEQHEGSGDETESTTINAGDTEHHVPEKVDISDEKIDQTSSPVTEQSATSIKDITHEESSPTTEKSIEKTTIGDIVEIETKQPNYADKPHGTDPSSTGKPTDSATEINKEATDKPEISQEEQEFTTPLAHLKPEADELENEIGEEGHYPETDNEPSRIPGEGDCLVEGVTYKNNSPIPTANKCQSSCRCVNSIIKCEHVQCSPPPADMVNCQPVYHAKDNCCPMYTCEHIEPVTIESENHMGDMTTLSPQETTVLSAHTSQASKDHDVTEHGTESVRPDDISQATQSPKDSDEQKIIPVSIGTDDSQPQDELEVHEKPIIPTVFVPNCGSNGCSPDSKLPTTDESELDQATESVKLDNSESSEKPIDGESNEKDNTLEQATTVMYDGKTDEHEKQKPDLIDATSAVPDKPSTELPYRPDDTDHTAIVKEITTSLPIITSDESTTIHLDIPHDKVDLEDDIGQNTIKPEDDSAVTTTEKQIYSEHATEKVPQELSNELMKITTLSPNQDSQESDDTSSEVDTEKPYGEQITEGPISTKPPGYEYSTPLNKLNDDSEITFIATTSRTVESESVTVTSTYDQKTDQPLDSSEVETGKVPSDTTKKPHSEVQTTVKPVTGDSSQKTNELDDNVSTVQYDQDKESSTESTDTNKSAITEPEEDVEHQTSGFGIEVSSDKPEETKKTGDGHDEASSDKPDESEKSDEGQDETSTIAQVGYTSSSVHETKLPEDQDKQHPDISDTQHKQDPSATDATISQIDDLTTTKYHDDSSSTKTPLEEDIVIDELTTRIPSDESDQFTIRPVVIEVTDIKKPSGDVPNVEEPEESLVTELDILHTTVKSNIQHTEEEPDKSIEETESATQTPIEIVTIKSFESTTLKPAEATTISSDDVNKIGVSVLPTDTVDEDCGSTGCSQNQPQDTVTSQTPIETDSQEKCGPQGCHVEAEFTRIPVDRTTELPNEIEECTSAECKLSQSTPPKAVDSPQCGAEGCEHDDQQNEITDDVKKSECGPNGCSPGSKPHVIPSEDSIKKESDKDGQCGAAGCSSENIPQSHDTETPHITPSDDSTVKESDKDGDCGSKGCGSTEGDQISSVNKPIDSSVPQNVSNENEQCNSPGCLPTDGDQSHSTNKPLVSSEDSCDGASCGDSQINIPTEKSHEKPVENEPSDDCHNGECSPKDEHVTPTEVQTTLPSANTTPVSDITETPEEHAVKVEDCGPQGCGSEYEKSTNVPETDVDKSEKEKPSDSEPSCESGKCDVPEKSTESPESHETSTEFSVPLITDKPTKTSDKPYETSSDDESKTEESNTLKSDENSESTSMATEDKTTEKTIHHKDDCSSPDCLEQGQIMTARPVSGSDGESSTESLLDITSSVVHTDIKCEGGNCPTDSVVSVTEPTDASPSDKQKPPKESDTTLTFEDVFESTTTGLVKDDIPSDIDQHHTTIKPSQVDSHTEKSDIDDRFSEDDKITESGHEITTLRVPTDEYVTEVVSDAEIKPDSDSDKHTTSSPKEPEIIKPHVPSTDIPVSLNVDDLVPVTDDEQVAPTTEFFVDMPDKQTLSPESHILEKDSDITTQSSKDTTQSSKDATQSSTEFGGTSSDKTEKYPSEDDIPVIIDGTKLPEQEIHTTKKPIETEPASKPQDTESITTESYLQTTIISKKPEVESTTKYDDSHDTKKPDVFVTSEEHGVTDQDHDADFITSTVPSNIIEEKLKPTVSQDDTKQSTDASVKDQSTIILDEVTSTVKSDEDAYKPTDKPTDVFEKSTLVSHQEQETESPIYQTEGHIPHTSEKDSAESTTEEVSEESLPHTTGSTEIVKETQKPIEDSESISGTTLAPESSSDNVLVGKDITTLKPESVDHSTKLPGSESETKTPSSEESSEITEHPEQSDITSKPVIESQEDTDQSSEEIEDNVEEHATSMKPELEVTKTADTLGDGIIKTTDKTVDDKESSQSTEKNVSDITDRPEPSKEQETTEKEVSDVTAQPEPSKDHVTTDNKVSDITEKPEPSKDQVITEKAVSDTTDKPESSKDQETTENVISDITDQPEPSKDQETTDNVSNITEKPDPSKDQVITEKGVVDTTEKPEPSRDQFITEKTVSDVTDQPEPDKDQDTTEKEVSDITTKPEFNKDQVPTEEEVHDITDKKEPSGDQVTTEQAVSELTEKPEPSKDHAATEVAVSDVTDKQVPSRDQVTTENVVSDVTDKPEPSKEEVTTKKEIDANIQEHDLGEVSTLTPNIHETKKPLESDDGVQTTDSSISGDKKHGPVTDSEIEDDGKTGKPVDDSESSTPNIGGSEIDVDVTTHYSEVGTVDKHDLDSHTTQKQPDVHTALNITETPNLTDEESGSTIRPQPDVTTIAETVDSHTESLVPSSTVIPLQHELTPANDTSVPSNDDEKIVPNLHDRYPETESSTDDISQAELPALPTPDQDHGHQVPQIPDFGGSYPSTGTDEQDYEEEDQPFGPGTCRYGGKVYVSAQQIPRDDPCDFCFCFRSDIICLQQSCPPPIQHCHEEPISGFCCPRYECPVSMATVMNVTTTTTTTTTTLPPHFLSHAYKGAAQKRGCQIKGQAYKVGDVVRSASGPCLHCTCGGDGQMKCDPKVCTPEPMLRQMIAVAATTRRR